MSEIALVLSVLGCVGWLTFLTRDHRRHVRQCVDGEPVYRKLPDGRVRFSWMVAERLEECERRAGADGSTSIR
ncbi:hypothetical protein [Pseudonocardia acaciae]|uniref:hypothetical protein n=1 Tax=Pseudonocardia acaciae TaxID=551276 RepID=UPI00048BD0A6|nr:hypothetical protein [Pseudonocardia acaciae]